MKRWFSLGLSALWLTGLLVGCGETQPKEEQAQPEGKNLMVQEFDTAEETYEGTKIDLSQTVVTVNGVAVGTVAEEGVYVANDIVYYESGKDFTYGEGEEADSHTKGEADGHVVVHITKPGQYVLTGTLTLGQIAVDLGDEAAVDPNAVVTLVLDGVDITCRVAPAVIFYNVYECGQKDEATATKDVDTSKAGARVIIANNSNNRVNGSYVARIYKPGTVELSEDGKEVVDAKKLHKYDAAFYSKMSMVVQGGNNGNGNGVLHIEAANEGLDSELHLTVHGGIIEIESGNDGINTNEDNVSVTTINGGVLNIVVNGATGEGDGIDSNGWLVINGGTVVAQACGFSGDSGIDSDKGIHINGGTVIATGNMLDRIEDGSQTYVVFTMGQSRKSSFIQLKNKVGDTVLSQSIANNYSLLVVSSPDLTPGEYTLWDGEEQLKGVAAQGGMGFGGPGGQRPEKPEGAEMPEGFDPPEGMEPPTGDRQEPPEGFDGQRPPEGFDGQRPEMPEGFAPPERPGDGNQPVTESEATHVFTIREGANYFQVV